MGGKVYLDTAFIHRYINREQFYRIVKQHGSDRILFATDSPWSDQKEAVEWLRDCKLSEYDKRAIFSENAKRLLK